MKQTLLNLPWHYQYSRSSNVKKKMHLSEFFPDMSGSTVLETYKNLRSNKSYLKLFLLEKYVV